MILKNKNLKYYCSSSKNTTPFYRKIRNPHVGSGCNKSAACQCRVEQSRYCYIRLHTCNLTGVSSGSLHLVMDTVRTAYESHVARTDVGSQKHTTMPVNARQCVLAACRAGKIRTRSYGMRRRCSFPPSCPPCVRSFGLLQNIGSRLHAGCARSLV